MKISGAVVSRHSYYECEKCGKHTPVGLGHACHPFQKYNRSKRLWVEKIEEEYTNIEKQNLIDAQAAYKKIIDEWDGDSREFNLDGKLVHTITKKPTFIEVRDLMTNNGWKFLKEED